MPTRQPGLFYAWKQKGKTMSDLRQYRSLKDEAERLGVTTATLHAWAKAGHIRIYQHERTARVDPRELDALMAGEKRA